MNEIVWTPVHLHVAKLALSPALPIAGTAEWQVADDNTRTAALIIAGSRWVLETEIRSIRQRRLAMKAAAWEISAAKDWSNVARRLRDRDAFLRQNADWAIRRTA